jgi:hypothetical protein
MKPAIEWLNEVGETVSTAMFSRKKPPGIEVEELIKRIQADAVNGAPKNYQHILTGVAALTNPDYHALNEHAGRNDRLLHAVLSAYAKHHLDCPDIGWNQLGDMLQSVICNEIGDDEFIKWGERITGGPR